MSFNRFVVRYRLKVSEAVRVCISVEVWALVLYIAVS